MKTELFTPKYSREVPSPSDQFSLNGFWPDLVSDDVVVDQFLQAVTGDKSFTSADLGELEKEVVSRGLGGRSRGGFVLRGVEYIGLLN